MNDEELLGFAAGRRRSSRATRRRSQLHRQLVRHRHPDERARVTADPGLTASVVEELRFELTPQLCRTTTRHPRATTSSGSVVVMVFVAANRDERGSTRRFDVTRRVDRHLAFGYGIRLRVALARLQAWASIDGAPSASNYSLTDTIEQRRAGVTPGRGAVEVTRRVAIPTEMRTPFEGDKVRSGTLQLARGRVEEHVLHPLVHAGLGSPSAPPPKSERTTMSYLIACRVWSRETRRFVCVIKTRLGVSPDNVHRCDLEVAPDRHRTEVESCVAPPFAQTPATELLEHGC